MITKMYDFKLIQPWDLTLKMHYKLNKALINQPTNTPPHNPFGIQDKTEENYKNRDR